MGLSFPCVFYKCGHNFHSLCLNANIGEDNVKIDCPICKKSKKKIEKEIKDIEDYYEFIKDNKNFNNEFEKSKDKMDFLSSMYGKGLFNFTQN